MCSENPFLYRYLLTVTSLRETGQRALWVFFFFFFLAMPYGLWDLNSPTRDWTWGHGRELDSREFSLGPLMLLCFCLVNMLCPTLLPPHGQPTRLLCPWDLPGKNTGANWISFSRVSSPPRDRTCICCIDRWFLYNWATRKVLGYLL